MVKLTITFSNDKKERLSVLTVHSKKYLDPLSHFSDKKYKLINYYSTKNETTCEFIVRTTDEEFRQDIDRFTDKIPSENYVTN